MNSHKRDVQPITYETVNIPLEAKLQTIRRPVVPDGAEITESSLVESARKASGLHFFGEVDFHANLRVFLHSLNEEAELNAFGRMSARRTIIARLTDRLRAQELFDRFPEILQRKLGPVTVIVGAARSGTTKVHRLLARDQRFLHLRDWEVNFPVPTRQCFGANPDPRISRARAVHKAVEEMNPVNVKIHPLNATAPEEEIGLLNQSFCGLMLESLFWTPTFGRWCLRNPQIPAYAYMKKLIQLISWFRNDPPGQPWILKSPQHMQDLDALLHVFPQAKIVFVHRDPVKTIPSNCSLVWNLTILGTDNHDRKRVGAYYLEKVTEQLAKVKAERATLLPESQQMDIFYEALCRDWKAEIQKIYRFIGTELDLATLNEMTDWVTADEQERNPGHSYAPEDFGLTAQQIRTQTEDYTRQFDVPNEVRP